MLSKLLFLITYILYISSIFMIGQIKVPGLPINFNILLTLILFIFCIKIERKLYTDKLLKYYWLFIAFYGLSALLTNYFTDFFHFLYSSVLMAYVAYWSTLIIARNYKIELILPNIIVIIGVFDAIVTTSQALGLHFYINGLVDVVSMNKELLDTLADSDYNMGVALSGIYYSPVMNGRYLLFFFLTSFLLFKNRLNSLYIFLSLIILIGIFYCQQRSAFFLSILSLIIIILNYNSKSKFLKYMFIGSVIISIIILIPKFLEYIDNSGSRLTENSGTGRENIWPIALDFILSNPLFAGNRLFMNTFNTTPHNLFLSAFIAGGVIGGTMLSILVIRLTLKSIKIICDKHKNYDLLVISLIILSLIGDSMFHNFGFVQADLPMFIGLALYNIFIENKKTFDNIS